MTTHNLHAQAYPSPWEHMYFRVGMNAHMTQYTKRQGGKSARYCEYTLRKAVTEGFPVLIGQLA